MNLERIIYERLFAGKGGRQAPAMVPETDLVLVASHGIYIVGDNSFWVVGDCANQTHMEVY